MRKVDIKPSFAGRLAGDLPGFVPTVALLACALLFLGLVEKAPAAGAEVTMTLTVVNGGPSPAPGVVIGDPLPVGLAFVSSAGCTYDAVPAPNGVVTCVVGTLANGATLCLYEGAPDFPDVDRLWAEDFRSYAAADVELTIPMQAGVDSLNVAAATAIGIFLIPVFYVLMQRFSEWRARRRTASDRANETPEKLSPRPAGE